MATAPLQQPRVAKGDGNLHLPIYGSLSSRRGAGISRASRPAVFLDRDGVLVKDVHFLREPSDLKVLAGVAEALRMLQNRYYTIVVTNQSGIARGMFTEDRLLSIHSELVRQLFSEGAIIHSIYFCPHLPEAAVPDYQVECDCRKPEPGMLLRAAKDWNIDLSQSFLVGDSPRDIEAAHAAGVKGVLLGETYANRGESDSIVADLLGAARLILDDRSDREVAARTETVGTLRCIPGASNRKGVV